MPRKKTPNKRSISDAHKEALAIGRSEGRAVRDYLEALRSNRPKRGRKRTPDSIARRLAAIETELSTADPVRELKLHQERIDLAGELSSLQDSLDVSRFEDAFVQAAAGYSERHGLSYQAWRQVGVEPAVLRRAGIRRSS